jgi:hypothetical protein
MRPAERYAAIQEIADFLAPKSESDADTILRAAGASKVTPGAWGSGNKDAKKSSVVRLLVELNDDNLVESLLEFLPGREPISKAPPTTIVAPHDVPPITEVALPPDGPIFVVHGHDDAILYAAVRVLERATGREVTVLHEQANAGRTILEKFEDYADEVSFAVVLLTGDDEGGIRSSGKLNPRARQNVIFELGFFFSKLGRKHVAVLLENNVEKPSDIDGLVYISFDEAGAWKYSLAKELEAAGIAVDRSRIP